jgi:hypothetical protein
MAGLTVGQLCKFTATGLLRSPTSTRRMIRAKANDQSLRLDNNQQTDVAAVTFDKKPAGSMPAGFFVPVTRIHQETRGTG